jgi:hypothetical protein
VPAARAPFASAGRPGDDGRRALRRAHDRAEARLRAADRQFLTEHRGAAIAPSVVRAASPGSSLPPTLAVADTVAIRVPGWRDQCTQFSPIDAVVRRVTERAVWLEDAANPVGYAPADLEALATLFETHAFDADVAYFGTPSDQDGNGRVAIVLTKEVNRISYEIAAGDPLFFLVGFSKAVDFVPRTTCPSSNEGEIVYLLVPDPEGTLGTAVPAATALATSLQLLPHELTHVLQHGRQLLRPGGVLAAPEWELEGQARLAEEVVGHHVTGLSPGQNYGFEVVVNSPRMTDVDWYVGSFVDLLIYYGLVPPDHRAENAPEQCSWLGMDREGNDGPCASNNSLVYGVSWSFLRWLSDQFGPGFPGGEQALHRALVDNSHAGFAAIEDVVHAPIDSLLAQWAAALYVDDRVPGAAARLTLPSWNLFDIETKTRFRELGRLLPRERPFAPFADQVSVRGGSTAYFRVSGAGRAATALRAQGAGGGPLPPHMRLWVVRLQ